MQKCVKIIFIALFFAIISLQFVLYFAFKGVIDTTNYENRTLLTFEDVLSCEPSKMTAQLEKLLNDHAPFKNQYLQFNAAANYIIFGNVQSSEVLLGEKQWLFYKNVSDSESLNDYQGINAYNEQQLQEFSQNMMVLNQLLKAKGTQLCLLVAPNKEQVYSQYMPKNIPKVSQSKLDLLVEHLNQNTEVQVIYPKKQLAKQSETEQVYYKYDTHWNNAGALVALKQISSAFDACTARIAKGEPLQDLGYLSSLHKLLPPDAYYEIYGTPISTNKSLIMFHDSFGLALVPQLSKAYNATFVNFSQFDPNAITTKADLVIIETSERFVDTLLPRVKAMIELLK